jgi:hypothetical protein
MNVDMSINCNQTHFLFLNSQSTENDNEEKGSGNIQRGTVNISRLVLDLHIRNKYIYRKWLTVNDLSPEYLLRRGLRNMCLKDLQIAVCLGAAFI